MLDDGRWTRFLPDSEDDELVELTRIRQLKEDHTNYAARKPVVEKLLNERDERAELADFALISLPDGLVASACSFAVSRYPTYLPRTDFVYLANMEVGGEPHRVSWEQFSGDWFGDVLQPAADDLAPRYHVLDPSALETNPDLRQLLF